MLSSLIKLSVYSKLDIGQIYNLETYKLDLIKILIFNSGTLKSVHKILNTRRDSTRATISRAAILATE